MIEVIPLLLHYYEERIPLLFSAEGLKNAVFTKTATDENR